MADIGKIVYLVRHGESEANAVPVFQSNDSPLSEKGKQQAERIAERASALSFGALISSPLPRARDTAERISRLSERDVEYSDLFRERNKPASTVDKLHADAEAHSTFKAWEESLFTPGLRVEDGENFDELVDRAEQALAYLAERPEPAILVVTHGFFLRTLVAKAIFGTALTGETLRHFTRHTRTENTGITALRKFSAYDGSSIDLNDDWHLWIFNDHAHLG